MAKQCRECYGWFYFEENNGVCPVCNFDYMVEKQTENINHLTFKQISEDIENAFFRLGRFTEGKPRTYKAFGFNSSFNLLFGEARKPENITATNQELICHYYYLIGNICQDVGNDIFNVDGYQGSDDFFNDCHELSNLYDRTEDFQEFGLPAEPEFYEKTFNVNYIKIPVQKPIAISDKPANAKDKLSQAQVALVHYYGSAAKELDAIEAANTDAIALQYGFKSPNSGNSLMKNVRFATDPEWRRGVHKKKVSGDKKKNLDKVLEYLSTNKHSNAYKIAHEEYKIFITKYNRNFGK